MTLKTMRLAAFALRFLLDSAPKMKCGANEQLKDALWEIGEAIAEAEKDLADIERPDANGGRP